MDQLIKDYSCICGVSPEAARQALERFDWNMQAAIDDFLDNDGEGFTEELVDQSQSSRIVELSANAPATFSLLSWNIDGLDDKNIQQRLQAVVELIDKDNYSVVFLQELTPSAFQFVVIKLQDKYKAVLGTENPGSQYFTATFLRKNHVIYSDHYIIDFPNSAMGHNLLVTKAFTGKVQLYFLNTHLESTAEFSQERMQQLKICFDHCKSLPQEATVIFGGDLNLRDKEVQSSVPDGMFDLWIHCGSRETCKYTWDLTRNTNKQMPSKFQPRCRFDRLYCRYGKPKTVNAEFFGTTGLERVKGTQSFPSDHWAIVTCFRLDEDARKPK